MHDFNVTERGVALKKARAALVLLHGRGATAGDILSLAPYFVNQDFYIAAPQANNYTWYPYSFMAPQAQNEPWLGGAINVVKRLVNNILEVLPSENIYIGGFSQGACLTAEFVARNPKNYGGVVIFTGGLIGRELNFSSYQDSLESTTIYMTNSDHDPHVPLSRSEESRSQFEQMGARVQLDVFPSRPHTILEEEIGKAKEVVFGFKN